MGGTPSAERPARHRLLAEHSGAVAADPDAVLAALAVAVDPGPESGFLVDAERRVVIVQGDYWYRGEYRVTGVDGGSRVDHAIVNVAARGPLVLGALTGRAAVRDAPTTFAALLAELGKVAGAD